MDQLSAGVIKRAALKQGAPRRISGGSAGMAPTPASMPQASGKPVTARVIQQNDTHAVIEVTCSCGQTIQLQCDYAQQAT